MQQVQNRVPLLNFRIKTRGSLNPALAKCEFSMLVLQ